LYLFEYHDAFQTNTNIRIIRIIRITDIRMRTLANTHENVEADTAKALKAKMTIDEQEQFVEVCDSDISYKFFTGSGTGPLYKYLRYKIPTAVGVVTEVDVFDTGGTMKTADNPDVSSKPDVPNKSNVFSKPDITSNVDFLCPRKTRLEGKIQHSTKPPDQSVPAKPVPAKTNECAGKPDQLYQGLQVQFNNRHRKQHPSSSQRSIGVGHV
jgi:hypothetical protein